MALPQLCRHAIEPVRLDPSMHLLTRPGNTSKSPLTAFLSQVAVLVVYGISWGSELGVPRVSAKQTGKK